MSQPIGAAAILLTVGGAVALCAAVGHATYLTVERWLVCWPDRVAVWIRQRRAAGRGLQAAR